ncbi:MAG: cytochrome c biogenesis protein CcdA [Spirochaetaceae bacterium]|jgi:cytochrome c-type biogenesis protein|nr:cytochrome c biogenesis protein CcdA [Spirochaetaceae bacterium]
MENNITILTAFIAGLLSFLSPCVLPLLSTYLVFISGNNIQGLAQDKRFFSKNQRRLIADTLCFIFGFSCVFVVLSILLYGFFIFMSGINTILNIISGSIVIILGLNIIFNFIPFLKYSTEETCATCTPKHTILSTSENSVLHPTKRPKGFLGSFLVGLAFGAGWTPCVGAFLGSILLLAGQSGKMALSALYLVVYSVGLGLPFLIAAFFWGTFLEFIAKIKRMMTAIKIISAVFLIGMGLLMLFGRFFYLNSFFLKTGYVITEWAQSGAASVKIIPACVFLFFAILIATVRIAQKKLFSTTIIISIICIALAVLNGLGVISVADLLVKWFALSSI